MRTWWSPRTRGKGDHGGATGRRETEVGQPWSRSTRPRWTDSPATRRCRHRCCSDPEVRRAAALGECRRDAHLTAELLRDPKSAAEALRHGLLHRADAERCVAERTHLAALAENPSLPADLVERLAVDLDEDVRLAVSVRPELASSAAANPALPEDEMTAVLDRAGVPT
ncbi:hypothetical protein [Streptomyces sp. NPDC101178]|uniref:hypothetical protein n=1 Tax=Streptomyces sp. NPDC101178 TaxID=3366124 RepID=UPI0037FEA278